MRLWHGEGWRDRRNHAAQADDIRLRRAIEDKTLVCEYTPAATRVEHLAPGETWPTGIEPRDWYDDVDRLQESTAPRTVTIPAVYKITNRDFRLWLGSQGTWPPSGESLLRGWYPDENWDITCKQAASEIDDHAARLGAQEKAIEHVAQWYGLPLPGLRKAFFDSKRPKKKKKSDSSSSVTFLRK